MNRLLVMFLKQEKYSLFPKFVVVFICQQYKEKNRIKHECWKFWDSLNHYLDSVLEVRIFWNFLNQIYTQEVLQFYYKVSEA